MRRAAARLPRRAGGPVIAGRAVPCGGAYHALVELAHWIPGGLDILMGGDFFARLGEG